MNDKRFIEVSFPVKGISEISAKEKNIRHGHISTLLIWWARRPLASSRAASYAALIPATDDVEARYKTRQFIMELSKWENSLNHGVIERAKNDILEANEAVPQFILINCCNHLSCRQKRFPLKPLQGFRGQRGGAPLLNSSSLSNSNRRTLSLNHQTLRKFDQICFAISYSPLHNPTHNPEF